LSGILLVWLAACGSDHGNTGSNELTSDAGTDACVGTCRVPKPSPDDTDSGGSCSVDADCDDGVFCNGFERCLPDSEQADPRGCTAAATPTCWNDVACDEPARRCACATPDRDGDGVASILCGGNDCDDDGDGYANSAYVALPNCIRYQLLSQHVAWDCDDDSRQVNPGSKEVCDRGTNRDEDCNPTTFAGTPENDPDADRDGDTYADKACCNGDCVGPHHGVDCNDDPSSRGNMTHPGAADVCNGIDDDCNGKVDDGDDRVHTYYRDLDGDGFGDQSISKMGCAQEPGWTEESTRFDCQDSGENADQRNPQREENCVDGIDNDCNGIVDDATKCSCTDEGARAPCGPIGAVTADTNAASRCRLGVQICEHTGLWSGCAGEVYPTTEVCDGTGSDEDCDGHVDEGATLIACYTDLDQDGFALADAPIVTSVCPLLACPPGTTPRKPEAATSVDCSDDPATDMNAQARHPGTAQANEICNGIDDDCDGRTDTDDRRPLVDEPSCSLGTLSCGGAAGWAIACPKDWLDCDHDVNTCCERPGTTLVDCHACNHACIFSCGDTDCDEISQIAANGAHVCGVTAAGRAVCWGSNGAGELGNGNTADQSRAGFVSELNAVKAVAVGAHHSCGIVGAEDTLYCWGDNDHGQLGDTDTKPTSTPTLVVGLRSLALTTVTSVAAGVQHTCAVFDGGTVACWGEQAFGRLGNGSTLEGFIKAPASSIREAGAVLIQDATRVVAGYEHTCIITNARRVECWGDNSAGQLGSDPSIRVGTERAVPVDGLQDVSALAAGDYHTCALSSAGTVYCWGDNAAGELGRPSDANDFVPRPVPGISGVRRIAAGAINVCAVTSNGDVQCWGSNDAGQLGRAESVTGPVKIDIPASVEVAITGRSACALGRDLVVRCWGANNFGQLGNGTIGDPRPTAASISPVR
jgi:alpha-tubulin suppressor-like RCC1 family protein